MKDLDTNEWYTPLFLLKLVQEFYQGEFLDPASCPEVEPYVKASKFYFKEEDGLKQSWSGRIWLNPPYSQPLVTQFTQKLISEYKKKNITEALLLVNSCTETKWFQDVAKNCDRRLDILGRLRFWNPVKTSNSPRYGQCLFYFGENCNQFENKFNDLGIIYKLTDTSNGY